MKVALSLAKHVNWRTKKLELNTYARIAEELNTFGVSPYYVGTIWRKHKQDILDTVNHDLVKSPKTLLGTCLNVLGSPIQISSHRFLI